jgi:hypothetical protein
VEKVEIMRANMSYHLDQDLTNADWTKTRWDLPAYKSPAFFSLVTDLEQFRTLPVYRYAVEKGWIVNDEWVGPSNPKG